MRNVISIGLGIAALLCALLLIQQSAAKHDPGQPSSASLSPLEMMKQPGKPLPLETWPAH